VNFIYYSCVFVSDDFDHPHQHHTVIRWTLDSWLDFRIFLSWLFLNLITRYNQPTNIETTLCPGYLGSRTDEERSEMRYVMRIAEFSESSNLWTQIAVMG